MFEVNGYHDVAMSDIAAAVGIVPSALYRHYRSKEEMLAAVLDAALSSYEAILDAVTSWDELSARMAEASLECGPFDLIWTRDRGHLSGREYDSVVERVRDISARVAEIVGDTISPQEIPADTIGWSVLAVMEWPRHRPLAIPVAEQAALLGAAADALIRAGRSPHAPHVKSARLRKASPPVFPDAGAGLLPALRREALLTTSITLFATRGYPNVSLDDIGDVVGIAGPSVYNHFANKLEILTCGLNRAFEVLWLDVSGVLRRHSDPSEALDELVSRHAQFAYDHWDLATVCLSHFKLLDDQTQCVLQRSFLDYLGEWQRLLVETRPELTPEQAQSLVELATAVNAGVVRVPGIRETALPEYSAALARAVLAAPIGPSW